MIYYHRTVDTIRKQSSQQVYGKSKLKYSIFCIGFQEKKAEFLELYIVFIVL